MFSFFPPPPLCRNLSLTWISSFTLKCSICSDTIFWKILLSGGRNGGGVHFYFPFISAKIFPILKPMLKLIQLFPHRKPSKHEQRSKRWTCIIVNSWELINKKTDFLSDPIELSTDQYTFNMLKLFLNYLYNTWEINDRLLLNCRELQS